MITANNALSGTGKTSKVYGALILFFKARQPGTDLALLLDINPYHALFENPQWLNNSLKIKSTQDG